jgi:hypothetical protein
LKCGINNDELLRTIWEHKKNKNRGKQGKEGKRGDFASFGTMPKGQGHYMYNRNFLRLGRVRSKDQLKQIFY